MKPSYKLVTFGNFDPAPIEDLARLHAELLPTSPIALLGTRFMKCFYYTVLPRAALILGGVAYIDGVPAGFIVATEDSKGFMQRAFRRYWVRLIWVIGSSILVSPKGAKTLYPVWRVMKNRNRVLDSNPEGEILSLGVIPACRDSNFVKRTGLQISNDLLDCAVTKLQEKGVRTIRAIVDKENTAAKMFYNGHGWAADKRRLSAWGHPTVEFVMHTKE